MGEDKGDSGQSRGVGLVLSYITGYTVQTVILELSEYSKYLRTTKNLGWGYCVFNV